MFIQYLGDPIIREHGQFSDIMKLSITFSLKFGIDVTDQDLRAFVKVNLVAFINGMVLKVRESRCKY